jgi:twitching motility protein PilT
MLKLLELAIKNNASDLHLSAGMPPMIRVDGEMCVLEGTSVEVQPLLDTVMNQEQQKLFKEYLEIDFAFEVPGLSRFRVNAFNQQRGPSAVFRIIPSRIPSLDELKGPSVFRDIIELRKGLVLVTGPTGSGKSTTLAAMIEAINQYKNYHILTIEDPIEFIYQSKKSLINQREVKTHTLEYSQALRSALRADPDVILVGELRDLDSIRLALSAAETGHLVLATLHTSSAAKTVDRIVDVFVGAEKESIRGMLAESLQAVISQTLVKKIGGGRVAAFEVMICNPAIRHLIRENKVAQMISTMQTHQALGMQTLDQALKKLVEGGIIDE